MKTQTYTYPLPVPDDLLKEIQAVAKCTGLSMADIMRQCLKVGLPSVKERLAVGRVTNVDPLPSKVLRKLYDEREEDMDSIRSFIAAQPKEAE